MYVNEENVDVFMHALVLSHDEPESVHSLLQIIWAEFPGTNTFWYPEAGDGVLWGI